MIKNRTKIEEHLGNIDPKFYPLLSFLLTLIVYTLTLSGIGMLGNGIHIIDTGDMHHQFIPFIMQMCEVIRGKHSLWYSWNIALGSGSIGNYAYFALSPFNIIYLVLGINHIHTASAIIIILKAAVSACTFQIFISRFMKKNYYETILFSLMYGLNGFAVCYYHVIIFMDAVLIFPIIMLGLVKLIREGKILILTVSYIYLIGVQIYMGYVVGVSSFVFFVIYFFYEINNKKNNINLKIVLRYFYAVAISLGITAFIWIPASLNIFEYKSSTDIYNSIPWCNPLILINNLFMGQYQSMDGFAPYYYCGIIPIILLPLFFLNKKIPMRKKKYAGFILCIFLCFVVIKPLNLFIHGLDQPNMIGYRYSFILSFIIDVIASIEYIYIKNEKIFGFKYIVGLLVSYFVIFSMCRIILIRTWGEEYDSNKPWIFIINVLLILVGYYILTQNKNRRFDRNLFCVLLSTFVICDLVTNIVICQYRVDKGGSQIVDAYFNNAQNNTIKKIEEKSQQKEPLRTIYMDKYINNVALMHDISSLSFFSPIINSKLVDFVKSVGFEYMPNHIVGNGWTPISTSLLSIDYVIDGMNIVSDDPTVPFIMLDVNEHYFQRFASNTKVLPLVFEVNNDIINYKKNDSVFENQNEIISRMIGEKTNCYTYTEMNINSDSARIKEGDDGVRIYNNNYPNNFASITYICNDQTDKQLYVNLYNEQPVYNNSTYSIEIDNGNSKGFNKTNKVILYPNQIFDVDRDEDNTRKFELYIPKEVEYIEYKKGYYAYYDEKEYQKAFDKLSSKGMKIDVFNDGYIKGSINMSKNGILFSSIPYEKGWNAFIDNAKVDIIPLLEGAFVGLEVPQGYHDVVFEYIAPGRIIGRSITLITTILICVYEIYKKIKKEKI